VDGVAAATDTGGNMTVLLLLLLLLLLMLLFIVAVGNATAVREWEASTGGGYRISVTVLGECAY
jgi:hypothetical protein